jgi:hypothetical protein
LDAAVKKQKLEICSKKSTFGLAKKKKPKMKTIK